jgi:DNA-directed RNA polymerase subunit RPC12/RpoP
MSVRTPLRCAECGRKADEWADHWKAYLGAGDPHEDDVDVCVVCPECATREFENVSRTSAAS